MGVEGGDSVGTPRGTSVLNLNGVARGYSHGREGPPLEQGSSQVSYIGHMICEASDRGQYLWTMRISELGHFLGQVLQSIPQLVHVIGKGAR